MSDRFDVRAARHRLKLIRDTGDVALYENRDGVACPGCGDPFDELLVTTERSRRFSPAHAADFCVVRESDRLLVCTHE